MEKILLLISLLTVCLLLLSSCGKSNEQTSDTQTTEGDGYNSEQTTPPTKTVIEQCLKNVPGIIEYEFVTEETDPHNNLNKSGWYIEKVYFSYALVNQENVLGETVLEKGLSAGGSIEVYRNKEDAEKRDEYLKTFDGTILYAGSHVVYGTCVVRASDELTAKQQETLEKNLIFALNGQVNRIIDIRVQYKINYYLENLDNKFILEKELFFKDYPNSTVTPTLEQFDNYNLDNSKSTVSGIVNADGSLVLNIYYKRNRFSVYCNTLGGEITSAKTCFYGQNITLTAEVTQLGYYFEGWYSNGKLLSNQKSYQCQVKDHIEAKFAVLPEMENFYFQSTSTTCKITDIKDDTVESITIPEYVTELSQCNLCFKNLKTLRIDAIKLNDINLRDEYSWVFYNESGQGVKVIIGKKVTRIPSDLFQKRLFSDSFNIKEVVFEDGSMCESIGQAAFMGQKYLESVNFGNNSKLKIISAFAFADCQNLKTINFGANSILETIEHDVFNSNKLTEIYIPKSVKKIGVWAFYIGSNAVNLKIYCEISESDAPSEWNNEWYQSYYSDSVEVIWNYEM